MRKKITRHKDSDIMVRAQSHCFSDAVPYVSSFGGSGNVLRQHVDYYRARLEVENGT